MFSTVKSVEEGLGWVLKVSPSALQVVTCFIFRGYSYNCRFCREGAVGVKCPSVRSGGIIYYKGGEKGLFSRSSYPSNSSRQQYDLNVDSKNPQKRWLATFI